MAIELGSAYGKVELDASGVKKGTQQAQDSLSQLDKTVQDVFKFSMGNLAAQGIGKLIGGMSELYGETKALTIGFDSQMAMMSTAVDPVVASIETLKDAALAVGGDISLVGIDAEQAAEAMTGLFKSGKNVNDIFGDMAGYMAGNVQLGGILRASVDLQAASMLDLDGATTLVNSTMSTYGLTTKDAVRVTDSFVKTADASQAEVTDLAEAHQNAAIVLASFGYTLEDTNTALALLSENSLKGAEAGTSLRAMVNNMLRPTKKTADAWKELNISLYDSEGQLKRLPDIIGEMLPALQNLSEERRNELAYILAGADGQRALNILLSKGSTGWRDMEQAIAGASSAQEVAAARANTLEAALEALRGKQDTLKTLVGDEFKPIWIETADTMAEFYDTHGPQIVAMAGKIADGITTVMDALEDLDPALVNSAVQLTALATVAGGGYMAYVKLAPVIGALGPVLSSATEGIIFLKAGMSTAEVATLGWSAVLGPIVLGIAAVTASVVAANMAIQLHKEIVENTAKVEETWGEYLSKTAESAESAEEVAMHYGERVIGISRILEEHPIAAAFVDQQKLMYGSAEDLNQALLTSANSYEDYLAAIKMVNEGIAEQATHTNWLGAEVVDTNVLIENSVFAVDEMTYAAEKNALSSEGAAAGTRLYHSALMDAVGATAMALTSTEGLIGEQVAAAESAENMATLYEGLSKALSGTSLSQSAMTRAQGELAAQMGYTTRLANMQASAMNLLAFEHAQGNISLEQYIEAGQQVQAINEDSLSGYQNVADVVAYATGKYGGLRSATADLPGAMHDAATAAQETAAAQEEMAQRAKAAWETFAGNVRTGVANALEAYKSGNTKMLEEQQRALGEMLWNQTSQMQGMGQITNDQAMDMKSALSEKYGIVVDETQLATDELLKLFNDWATGGQTSADDVVAFIQNIGSESATLKANAEGDIQAQIKAWEDLQASTDTSSVEAIADIKALALETGDQGKLVEAALGDAGGAAGTMAGDVEGAAGRATTAIGGIATAIENLPEYKKIEIEIEKTGDEAFDFGSPQFRFFYALEDLVDYAGKHPVEIDVASQLDGGMALDVAAMASLAPVTVSTPTHSGMYDQRQYNNNVTMPVTAVQDALDIERLAQRVVALIRNRQ